MEHATYRSRYEDSAKYPLYLDADAGMFRIVAPEKRKKNDKNLQRMLRAFHEYEDEILNFLLNYANAPISI